MTSSMPDVALAALLDVLDLFTEFLEFGFHADHLADHVDVAYFGAEGVDFALDFLGEKV